MNLKIKCHQIGNPKAVKHFVPRLVNQKGYLAKMGYVVAKEPKKAPGDEKPKGTVKDIKDLGKTIPEIITESTSEKEMVEAVENRVEEIAEEMNLEQAREAYLEKFGKKAHHASKLETILTKLNS